MAGAGPWGGIAVPQGAGAVRVGPRVGEARWHRGKRESWGRECLAGGVGGAVPLVGSGSSAGLVVRGAWAASCGAAWYLGRGGVTRPPCISCVGVLRRVRWVRRHGPQLVRIQWWLRGVFRVGVGLGGRRSFGVDVVAGEIRYLVGGGQPLVVDMVVGLSSGSVVVLVVVVVVALEALVVVLGLVVVVVLGVCPQDPLVLQRDLGVGNHLQPLGLPGRPDSCGGLQGCFDGDRGRGVPRARVGLAGGGGGMRMPDGRALGDGDVDEGLDGSCFVAAPVVAVSIGGRGARDAVVVGPWWRGRLCCCCCRPFCDCWGCVW